MIFLHQWGGPSHHDTFDMKPAAPDAIRGEFKPIASNLPGVPVCERLPGMTRVMNKVTLVRTLHHTMKNHNSAGYYSLTGYAPPTDDQRLRDSSDLFPAYGSVVDRLAPARAGVPTFVAYPHTISDGSITPGQHASFLGKAHDPLFINQDPNSPDFRLPELSLPDNLSPERLGNRREMLRLIDRQTELLDFSAKARGIDAHYERAMTMLSSPAVKKAFDLSAEPDRVRDRYGRTTYGQGCLLARRLVEAGARFINVYFSRSIGGCEGGWDTHGFNDKPMYPILKKYLLPITNQTLPTLLDGPRAARFARGDAGRMGGRVRPFAAHQQAGRARSLAAVLHGAAGRRRRQARPRPRRLGQTRRLSRQAIRCGQRICRRRCSTCWASIRRPKSATRSIGRCRSVPARSSRRSRRKWHEVCFLHIHYLQGQIPSAPSTERHW